RPPRRGAQAQIREPREHERDLDGSRPQAQVAARQDQEGRQPERLLGLTLLPAPPLRIDSLEEKIGCEAKSQRNRNTTYCKKLFYSGPRLSKIIRTFLIS